MPRYTIAPTILLCALALLLLALFAIPAPVDAHAGTHLHALLRLLNLPV